MEIFYLVACLIFYFTRSVNGSFLDFAPPYLANDALNGEREYANISGDIKLGALVAIYDAGGQVNRQCKTEGISPFGIQRVEAMKFAVNEINAKGIIPNVTLGIEIRDSCGTETHALDEALHFVTDRVPTCIEDQRVPIFGVVGASMSLLTAAVANLLRLFQIPLVSYAATSTELSNKEKYDFLLRTVPPDNLQSAAMVDFIIDVLGWKSVFIIYSAGSYGEYGFESFMEAVDQRANDTKDSLCIVDKEKVKPGISEKEMLAILDEFNKGFKSVVGIVCYCEIPDVTTLVKVIDKHYPRFRLIGSDTTLSGAKTNKSIIFSLAYDSNSVSDFYKIYRGLTPKKVNVSSNPWFHQFWNESCAKLKAMNPGYNDTDCSSEDVFGFCRDTPIETNDVTCPQDDKIPYTIDAIYAYAYAIRNLLESKPDKNVTRLLSMNLKNRVFFDEYLKKVEFDGRSGSISFGEDVERGAYDIIQFIGEKRSVLGMWKEGSIYVNQSIQETLRREFDESTCQPKCKNNEEQVEKYKTRCCWTCEACADDEYLRNNTCFACDHGQQPNKDGDGCVDTPIEYIKPYWQGIIGVLSTIGIICTLFTFKVFIKNNDTPLVKASGRELTYLLLLGILMLFCNPLFMIPEPSDITCGISRFNFGIFLCLCYGSLLVKTNRIARIFTGKQDLLFLTPNWQLILTAFIMMPQVLITSIGLVKDRTLSYINYDIDPRVGYHMCSKASDTGDIYGTIVYNILLVIMCTYYAFLTRKVPANFNESRYIGFVMYTTIVIWCAFLPVYFWISLEQRLVFLMLDHILNALTLLIGLFGMKMYILLLKPDKNTMANSKTRSVTYVSELDTNGTVYIDGLSNGVAMSHGRYKAISTSTLGGPNTPTTAHHQNNNSEDRKTKEFYIENEIQTEDRGTSTSAEPVQEEKIGNGFHAALHKTFTM
eukprot:TCONS_00055036-protein